MTRRSLYFTSPAKFQRGTKSATRTATGRGQESWSAPWSVFDIQTTGIDAGFRVIEIAMLDCGGQILIDTMVNPGVHVPATSARVTGINDSAVKAAPAWPSIWSHVEGLLLAQNHIFSWNSECDLRAIRRECVRTDDLIWTSAIDARFVDLARVALIATGYECSFEELCALASVRFPPLGHQRAADCCRAALYIIQALNLV